jgi:hypothetical protein
MCARSMTRAGGWCGHPPGPRVGGDLTASADGAAVSPGDGRVRHREGGVYRRGQGPGRDPQLQRRRVQFAVSQVQGRPPKFTLPQRREVKKIARSHPADYGLPFSTGSLSKLAEFLVAEGVVDDISHEGRRILLREEGVTFQRLKAWRASKDPHYAAKKSPGRAAVRDRRP